MGDEKENPGQNEGEKDLLEKLGEAIGCPEGVCQWPTIKAFDVVMQLKGYRQQCDVLIGSLPYLQGFAEAIAILRCGKDEMTDIISNLRNSIKAIYEGAAGLGTDISEYSNSLLGQKGGRNVDRPISEGEEVSCEQSAGDGGN